MRCLSLVCILFAALVAKNDALRAASSAVTRTSTTRLHESFGIDSPTVFDAVKNTPPELLGEVNYKERFVASYKRDALLLDEDLVTKIRKNRLLALTAESGLLEALQEKGLSLSKIEKLLPVIDQLELLPLAEKNRGLILSALPLIVDTAFLVLPLAVSFIKTGSGTFSSLGLGLIALGGYEGVVDGNGFLSGLAILLGLPAVALGSVLGIVENVAGGSIAAPSSYKPLVTPSPSSSSTVLRASSPAAKPSPKDFNPPTTSAPKVTSMRSDGGSQNGKRKTIKIRR